MSQINSYIKDDIQVVLLLSCFVGHPVAYVRKITKNCTVHELILLGVKVDFNDKRGGLVF